MARVTVEDCIDKVENRFDLVTLKAEVGRDPSERPPRPVEPVHDEIET